MKMDPHMDGWKHGWMTTGNNGIQTSSGHGEHRTTARKHATGRTWDHYKLPGTTVSTEHRMRGWARDNGIPSKLLPLP